VGRAEDLSCVDARAVVEIEMKPAAVSYKPAEEPNWPERANYALWRQLAINGDVFGVRHNGAFFA
jgi:hypothetical protein